MKPLAWMLLLLAAASCATTRTAQAKCHEVNPPFEPPSVDPAFQVIEPPPWRGQATTPDVLLR